MRLTPIVLLLACVAISGCGSDDAGDTATAVSQQTTEERSASAAPTDAASLRDCLEAAGASIASGPSDLKFAEGTGIGTGAETDAAAVVGGLAVYSFKPSDGAEWRIYAASPDGSDSPGYSGLLADPSAATITAYVNGDATAIAAADRCLGAD